MKTKILFFALGAFIAPTEASELNRESLFDSVEEFVTAVKAFQSAASKGGLASLFTRCEFEIEDNKAMFTVYHTLHWIVHEWLSLKSSMWYKILRVIFLVPLALLAKKSTLRSDKLASVLRIVVRKPFAPNV